MNYEKIEDRRKGSNIFRFHGCMYKKTMNAKIKLTCVMFSIKKTSGTAFIEFGKFFNNQKHNHPKSFEETEKTKIEARIKYEYERSTVAPRDVYNKNINPENVDISSFTKISSIKRKRRANNFPPIPRKVGEFDNWKTLILGQLMAISFTEQSLPPTMNSR